MKASILGRLAVRLLPLLAAAVLLVVQVPWTETLTYQRYDEGYNGCMMVSLQQGYRLYTDLWLDQPPLFFRLLYAWLHGFGTSLLKGRALAFLLSVLFAGLLHDVVRRRSGPAAAWLTLALVLTNPVYAMMSVAMIQELPAYTFGGLALWLATLRHGSSRPALYTALSACAMACSLLTKLATAPLALVILFDLACGEPSPDEDLSRKARRVAAWCIATGLAFLAFGWLMGVDFQNLLLPHMKPMQAPVLESQSGTRMLPVFAFSNGFALLLAVPGFFFALRGRERPLALPLLWLAVNAVLLNFYTPVAAHYELHVAVPLSWLAGAAAARMVGGRWLAWVGLAALAAIPGNRFHLRAPTWQVYPDTKAAVQEYAPQTRWMAAVECQIYPFLSGVRVIPDLYTTSLKRNLSGDISPERMLQQIEQYQPEQLLLDNRFAYPPEFGAYLKSRYRARFPDSAYIQWVRRDIANPADGWSDDPAREALRARNEARIRPFALALLFLRHGQTQAAERLLTQALEERAPALAAHRREAREVLAGMRQQEGPR